MAFTESKIEQRLEKEISSIINNPVPLRARRYNVSSSRAVRKQRITDKRRKERRVFISHGDFFADKMLMIEVIRRGVTYALFDAIKQYTPFTENDWADFLNTTTKSLQRYKRSAKSFKPIQSEKIIEMAEVTNLGLDVFGDMEKLKLWLNTPSFALGNMKPMELLKDSYGKEMVMSELTRINYGILA